MHYIRCSASTRESYIHVDSVDIKNISNGVITSGTWRNSLGNGILNLQNAGNRYSNTAGIIWDKFCGYFNTVSKVLWQNQISLLN